MRVVVPRVSEWFHMCRFVQEARCIARQREPESVTVTPGLTCLQAVTGWAK